MQTYRPDGIQQPNITDGALTFKSNYWSYGNVFYVDLDLGNKVLETSTTYKIKLTGSASPGSQMWFKFGTNDDPNYGWRNVVMKDAQGNSFHITQFTDGVLEFYATTESQILTVDQFNRFQIFLDWTYGEASVSISSIEITKV